MPGRCRRLRGAEDKIAQLDATAKRRTTINLGMPAFGQIAARAGTAFLHDGVCPASAASSVTAT
jgi:hypothetical protein